MNPGPVKPLLALLASLTLALGLQTSAAAQTELPACPICDAFDLAAYAGPLEDGEVIGLLHALNDEYHAWALYDQVIAEHGPVTPFTNILGAEAQHVQRLVPLFEGFAVLPVPENPWPGQVASFPSLVTACLAGVEAELVNIELYDWLLTSTEREDILAIYRDLQRASQEKHLPAFERCAGVAGDPGGGPGAGPGGDPGRIGLTERAYLPRLVR